MGYKFLQKKPDLREQLIADQEKEDAEKQEEAKNDQ